MEDDFILIDLVKKIGHIYDKKTPDFKSKSARRNAWETIGKILNRDADECESRWSILRNRYSNEKRKIRKCFPDVIDKNIEHSEWFRKMTFLDTFIIPRQSYKHLKRSDDSQLNKLNNSSDIEVMKPVLDESNSIEEDEIDSQSTVLKTGGDNCEIESSNTSGFAAISSSGRKRNNSNFDEIFQETLTTLLNYLKQNQRDIENDVDLSFGKAIALQLKEMPPEKKKIKQKQIMELILD